MLFFKALWYDWIDFTRTQIGYFIILGDAIINGLTACIAFILQIIIFKVTTQRPLRYWIIILAGIAIFASSYLGILYPKSGFIAFVLFLAAKSYKNLRHTILETFFIPFTFALMVRLVIFLIIPIFFPVVLDYYFAGPFNLFLSFLLCFAQNVLLQVDYSRMKWEELNQIILKLNKDTQVGKLDVLLC